ncbi:MAG: winged helix-turn-helix transcriptional regulator [Thermoleophilaceae bacterium]|nr:winged helix-turn-helix transcriptional regulator [Thermoleophilaceae bacterium]
MTTKRTYGEACAAAHALDLVGERWAMLVVRELLLGPKRFTDLREGILHASPNVLAQRLRDLERSGVVQRRKLPPPFGSWVYELTDWGMELAPVLNELGRWGSRSPLRPQDAGMSVDSHILALRAMFDPEIAGDLRATYALRLGENRFQVDVADGAIAVGRGDPAAPVAVIEAEPGTLAALIWGGMPLKEALRGGDVRIEGDEDAVARFLTLFPLGEPAALAAST